jgi:putative ATP-dependent endonuclease of OLD family
MSIGAGATCIIGENNVGKSNLLHGIRLCIDAELSSMYRSLIPTDIHFGIDISYPEQVLVALEITDFAGNKRCDSSTVGHVQGRHSGCAGGR